MDLFNAKMLAAGAVAAGTQEKEIASKRYEELTAKWKEYKDEKHLPSQDWIDLQYEINKAREDLAVKEAYLNGLLNLNLLIQGCK